jgi:tetratricopeptide (TPR) repeat protein
VTQPGRNHACGRQVQSFGRPEHLRQRGDSEAIICTAVRGLFLIWPHTLKTDAPLMKYVRMFWQKHKGEILWAGVFAFPAAYLYEWAHHGFPLNSSWIRTVANYRIPVWYFLIALVVLYLLLLVIKRFGEIVKKRVPFGDEVVDEKTTLNPQPAVTTLHKNVDNSSVLVESGVHVSAQSGGISIGVVTGEVKIGLTEEVFRQQLESTVRSLSQEIIEATRTNDGDTVRRLTKEIDVANAKLADISGTLASREAELKSAYEKLDLIKDQLPTEQVARAKSFLLEGKTDLAEGLFDSIVHKGVSHIAESAFQSGQLAEGRFEYIKAYGSYRTAAALENNAPFWLAVGRVANVLGKFDEAVHFLVPLLSQFRNDASKDSKLLLAQVTNELAIAYKEVNKLDDAERFYFESLDVIEPLTGRVHPEIAVRLNNLALILSSKGEYDKAESMTIEALNIISATSGPESPQIGSVQVNLANIYVRTGKFDKAEDLLKKADNHFNHSHDRLALSSSMNSRGELYRVLGRLHEAEKLLQKAYELKSNLLGPDHLDVATILNNLALVYNEMGKYDEVESMHQRVLKIRKVHLGNSHPLVANTLNNIAWFHLGIHRYKEAITVGQEALSIRERVLGPNHPDTANTVNGLGAAHLSLHEFDQAEIYLTRALSIKEKVFGPDSHEALPIMINLGLLYTATGRLQLASEILSRNLQLCEKSYGLDGFELVASLAALGGVSKKLENLAQADKYYDRALNILHMHFPMGHPYVEVIKGNRSQ